MKHPNLASKNGPSFIRLYYNLYYGATKTSHITIRVNRNIKEKLEKYHVNVSETVRELLDKYLAELETKDLAQKLDELQKRMCGKIDAATIAKLVREDREKR